MGRPRKPTALVLLKGMAKRNPGRLKKQGREHEPQNNDPLPSEAPDWMTPHQQETYLEIVRTCHKDVLCVSDAVIVEMVALLTYEMRTLGVGDAGLNVNKLGKLITGLNCLGMTPSARSKVQAIPRDDKKDTPLNEFAA